MSIIAKALLQDGDGNILVLRRSHTHPLYAHHLDFPGGTIEPGEEIIEGVVREIDEETRLAVHPDKLSLVFTKPADDELHHLYVARLEDVAPQVIISWEHSEHHWMTAAELLQHPMPQGVDSYYLAVVEWLKQTPGGNTVSPLLQ